MHWGFHDQENRPKIRRVHWKQASVYEEHHHQFSHHELSQAPQSEVSGFEFHLPSPAARPDGPCHCFLQSLVPTIDVWLIRRRMLYRPSDAHSLISGHHWLM